MSDRKRNSYHRDEHNRVSDSNRCRIPDSSSRDSGTKRKAQSELASDGKRTRMTMDVNAIREQQRLLKQQQEQQKQQQKQTQQSNVSQKPDGIQIDGITRIRKFDMRRINIDVDGQRILIVGQSGSGKSSITLEIMRYNKDIPVWMIVSPTEKMNQTYTPFIHPACIHDELDLASLRRFKKRQEDRCSKWRVPGSTKPFKYRRNPSGAVILDDVIVSAKLFKDEIFRWAYFNSRHAKTLWIQLTQYAMLIPSDHRRNIKYLILFQQSSNTEIKKLFYEFGGAFTKLSDFNRTLKLCTQNFGAMIIDCLHPSTEIREKVFYYRAPYLQPPFKAGAKWWHAQLDKEYDPDWEKKLEKEDEDEDIEPPKKKGRKAAAVKKPKNADLDIELDEE